MNSEVYEKVAAHVERHKDKIQMAFSVLGMKSLLAEIDALKAMSLDGKPTAYVVSNPDPVTEPDLVWKLELTPADRERGWIDTPLYAFNRVVHPTNGLPQTFEQIIGERDLLLMSVRALQLKIERINRVSKSRLTRMRKAKSMVAKLEQERDERT